MSPNAKVLIVGSGIHGLSTAWALARRGFSVEVFEQDQIPSSRASSYDEHRITRHAYGDAKGYARLMPDAFTLWDRLFADIGARHFDEIPLLILQRERVSWLQSSLDAMDEMRVPYREVPPERVAERYPMLIVDGITEAYECGGGGVLFPIRILTDLVVHLAGRGVVFHPRSRVEAIDPLAASLTVGSRRHAGDALVVAAGAWAGRLVPALAETAVPSRQGVLYLAPPPEFHDAWRRAPVILDIGLDSGTYALPPRPGTRLKIGDHNFSRAGDPDEDRVATAADLERLLTAAPLVFRDFARYTAIERRACYYTVTADESFVVKPIGPNTYLQSACSGHGFKLGPLIGEGVARVIAGEWPASELADWAAGRSLPVQSEAA